MYSEEIKGIIQSKYMIVLELEQNFSLSSWLIFFMQNYRFLIVPTIKENREVFDQDLRLYYLVQFFSVRFPVFFFSTSKHVLFICFL